jgi:acyl-CoA thioester hydrolase
LSHTVTARALFGDADPMGVVYYGNYLRFFELGRAELMRAGGRPYAELAAQGLHLPATEAYVRYRRPALYDQKIAVRCQVAWVKKASLRFNYLISPAEGEDAGKALVEGYTVHGCVDASGRVQPLPGWVAELAREHLA